MAVYFDDWKRNENEGTWYARRRYNGTSPLTVLQYSSHGWPLAIGGEVAARSEILLRDVGITCRLCVAGQKTEWEAGQKPPPLTGVHDLKDFVWNFWCTSDGFSQINQFVRNVAVQLRTHGVLLYCKQGANRSAAAAIAVITYITGAPWMQCEDMARRARAIVDISSVAPKFTTIVNSFPTRELEDAVLLTQLQSRSIANASLIFRQRDHIESSSTRARQTMEYNDDGSVRSWGAANDTMPVDVIYGTGSRVEEVECWRLLHVTAYVRDYVGIQAPYKGDHGWDFYSSYWVNDWSEIQVVFQRFFDKGGFYHRVSFHVEVCYWNQSEGWSYDDRV